VGFDLEVTQHVPPAGQPATGHAPPSAEGVCAAPNGHLRIVARGELLLPAVYELIDRIKAETGARDCPRVLLDMRAVPGMPSETERYKWGVRIADVIGWRVRLAIVAAPEAINKLAENTAVNRGANLIALSDEQEALRWLYA
jgi:hypothetical protein